MIDLSKPSLLSSRVCAAENRSSSRFQSREIDKVHKGGGGIKKEGQSSSSIQCTKIKSLQEFQDLCTCKAIIEGHQQYNGKDDTPRLGCKEWRALPIRSRHPQEHVQGSRLQRLSLCRSFGCCSSFKLTPLCRLHDSLADCIEIEHVHFCNALGATEFQRGLCLSLRSAGHEWLMCAQAGYPSQEEMLNGVSEYQWKVANGDIRQYFRECAVMCGIENRPQIQQYLADVNAMVDVAEQQHGPLADSQAGFDAFKKSLKASLRPYFLNT